MPTAVLKTRADEVEGAFAHLHSANPVLAGLIDKRPDYDPDAWRQELPDMDLFGCLLFQITGQQISVVAAGAILDRLRAKFDGRMPTPEEVVELDLQTLRDVGMSRRKGETIHELAVRFADGRLSEERLALLTDDEIIDELTQIKGIGRWTVHGALLIALRRSNVVPTGDIMLRNAVKRFYALEEVPSEDEFLEIAATWHPHGSLGVNLLFAAHELDREVKS